jgi:rhodanese-related sulfurtransferase
MITRRAILGLGVLALAGGVAGYRYRWPSFAGQNIDAPTAHACAMRGEIMLVDIRRPDEWQATGVGEGAFPIDMRRDDFALAVVAQMPQGATLPIALICARGVRSAHLATLLAAAGQYRIINVPEGMLGSSAGPGWIARNLPLRRV